MRHSGYSIDTVLLTPSDRHLAVLLARAPESAPERWIVPWDAPRSTDATLADTAIRVARASVSSTPPWIDQVGAFADSRRHPSNTDLSIGFAATIPLGTLTSPRADSAWFPVVELPSISPRQRAIITASIEMLRAKLDSAPVAFRLLPPTFTLSELQRIYEILLGERLHKASFRRALQASTLAVPTEEWRSEGRGRPAQLFKYSPRRRRSARRGLRFDLIVS
jgi:8-oxo-dGTP diphosphatase